MLEPGHVTLSPIAMSCAHASPCPQMPHQLGSSDDCLAFSLVPGQVCEGSEGVSPFLQVIIPFVPAETVAWPLKSHTVGDAEAP